MIVAAPALVETYSVLTRLPATRRLPPRAALAILETSFMTGKEIVALDAAAYAELLRDAPTDGILGGGVYDAVIAHCALASEAEARLSFNERQFRPFAGRGMEIVVPA